MAQVLGERETRYRYEPLDDMDDRHLGELAYGVHALLGYDNNSDILDELPEIAERYGGDGESALGSLIMAQQAHRDGQKMEFGLFNGNAGAGWASIVPESAPLEDASPEAVRLSLFVCMPYRNHGLGNYALRTQLRIVDRYFHGEAWASVTSANAAAATLVAKAGMTYLQDYTGTDGRERGLYTYRRNS